MTPEELASKVAVMKEHGRTTMILNVNRTPRGERMRVLPGVMGVVLSVNQEGRTNCLVQVADVEKALEKAKTHEPE